MLGNEMVAYPSTCAGFQHLPAPEPLLDSEFCRMKRGGGLLHVVGSLVPNCETRPDVLWVLDFIEHRNRKVLVRNPALAVGGGQ
jgi:hypothetical protein